ncbi:MAG: hypothetical protein ACT4PM_09975 [Gemmatimonadales bacterium]
MAARPTPFELVFGEFRDRFEAIQQGLEASGVQADDRDRFLLQREAAELMRELRPEAGLGAEVEMLGALVHHAYRFWRSGERVRAVSREDLVTLLEGGGTAGRLDGGISGEDTVARPTEPGRSASSRPAVPLSSAYIQVSPLAVWARLESGPPEPLDGWFAARVKPFELEILGILGMHPGRAGFTAVEVRGPRPDEVTPANGSTRFAPIASDTGAQAGLAAVRDAEELLALAWRVEDLP